MIIAAQRMSTHIKPLYLSPVNHRVTLQDTLIAKHNSLEPPTAKSWDDTAYRDSACVEFRFEILVGLGAGRLIGGMGGIMGEWGNGGMGDLGVGSF